MPCHFHRNITLYLIQYQTKYFSCNAGIVYSQVQNQTNFFLPDLVSAYYNEQPCISLPGRCMPTASCGARSGSYVSYKCPSQANDIRCCKCKTDIFPRKDEKKIMFFFPFQIPTKRALAVPYPGPASTPPRVARGGAL